MKRKPKGTTIFNIVVILVSLGMLAYFAFSEDGLPVAAPRAALCAAHQATAVLRILLGLGN